MFVTNKLRPNFVLPRNKEITLSEAKSTLLHIYKMLENWTHEPVVTVNRSLAVGPKDTLVKRLPWHQASRAGS